jgi:precorrin-8X/cobalt-precorrin-8 methylmutase
MRRAVHPIEVESYRILRSRVDTAGLPPLTRAVVERVVHTTADPTWVGDVRTTEPALSAGRVALLTGRPLVTDVHMVAAGITSRDSVIGLRLPGAAELAAREGLTRSAAGIRLAAERHRDDAVWVIGNAPTALAELVRLARAGEIRPALVVGVPVGFVGAVAAKADLRAAGLPSVSTMTERGGAAIAVAIVNALLYFDENVENVHANVDENVAENFSEPVEPVDEDPAEDFAEERQ